MENKYRVGDVWKFSDDDFFIVKQIFNTVITIRLNRVHRDEEWKYDDLVNGAANYHLDESSRIRRTLELYEA